MNFNNVYPLTRKTAIQRVTTWEDVSFIFFDTSHRALLRVSFADCNYNISIYHHRTLLCVRKDTLKKLISHISQVTYFDFDTVAVDLYNSLQAQGLYSEARIYHKKIFEKR